MANKNLLKKIAPVILSATVAMTGMPSAAFAAEFSDEEVLLDGSAEDEEADVEIADTEADVAEDEADTDIAIAEQTKMQTMQKQQKRNFSMQKMFLAQKARQKLLQKMVMLLKAGLYMVQQTFRMPISFMVR